MPKKLKREDFTCNDYAPLPGEVRCQHWGGKGACKLDTRFMCEEWERMNPNAAEKLTKKQCESEKKLDEQLKQADWRSKRVGSGGRPGGGQRAEQATGGRSERNRGDRGGGDKHTRQLTGLGVAGVGQIDDEDSGGQRRTDGGKVYNISEFVEDREGDKAPLIERPELLTVEVVDALAARGMEVAFNAGDIEMTLVSDYTGADRAELTYQDARTLIMVMQVFPGATVQSLKMPKKEEVL